MKAWICFVALCSVCFVALALQSCGGGGSGTAALPPPTITYINGGISGSGTVGSVFIIDGDNFLDLSAPAAGFSVDFRDATTNAVVASAPVNYADGDWTNTTIKGAIPNATGITPGTIYKMTVTTANGTTAGVNFLVTASVALSPSTITWSSTTFLPQAQQGFPTIIAPVFQSLTNSSQPAFKSLTSATNYVYTLGGNTSTATAPDMSANVTSVYLNKMDNSTGALANASWAATAPLPDKRGFAAGVLANGFNSGATGNGTIYVVGGLDGTGAATSTVYYASIAPDGTIPASGTGSWTATSPLPQPLFATAAVILHNRLYVVGGNGSTGAPVAQVYSAAIHSDSTLGSWQTLADLPAPVAYHQLVAVGEFLYVLGGDNAAATPITNVTSSSAQDRIDFSRINLQNGTLAAWQTSSIGMSKAREKFTAVAVGNAVVVTGGLKKSGLPSSNESRYGIINTTDGSLSAFAAATGTNTISSAGSYNPYNHSTAFFVDSLGNPHILILGGADIATGLPHSDVWYQH